MLVRSVASGVGFVVRLRPFNSCLFVLWRKSSHWHCWRPPLARIFSLTGYTHLPHFFLFSVFLISFMTLWSKQLKQGTFVKDSRSLLSLSLSYQTICSCKEGDFDLQGKLLSGDLIRSYPLISYGIWVNQGGSIFLPYTLILPFCFCTHNSILLLLV